MDAKKLGLMIRNLRKAKGFSQDTLRKQLNCSLCYISQVERGERNFILERAFKFEKICGDTTGSISGAIIQQAYEAGTGLKYEGGEMLARLKNLNKDDAGTLIELGELAGRKVKLRLELE